MRLKMCANRKEDKRNTEAFKGSFTPQGLKKKKQTVKIQKEKAQFRNGGYVSLGCKLLLSSLFGYWMILWQQGKIDNIKNLWTARCVEAQCT